MYESIEINWGNLRDHAVECIYKVKRKKKKKRMQRQQKTKTKVYGKYLPLWTQERINYKRESNVAHKWSFRICRLSN